MSKFGKKFTCWSCGSKFYDLNKPDPKCPKCGSSPEDDPNKGMPIAPAPAAAEDFGDEVEEEVDEESLDDDEGDDEAGDDSVDEEY